MRNAIKPVGPLAVFTTDIQPSLLENQVDLAVHSLKDLPTEPTPGLCLAAVPARAAVGDALLIRPDSKLLDQSGKQTKSPVQQVTLLM